MIDTKIEKNDTFKGRFEQHFNQYNTYSARNDTSFVRTETSYQPADIAFASDYTVLGQSRTGFLLNEILFGH